MNSKNMARKKLEERYIRKLSKVGNNKTYIVSLPVDAIRKLDWQKKQKVVIETDYKRKRFIIKDWVK